MAAETSEATVFCRDCGSEIDARAEICPECGIRQQGKSSKSGSAFSQYTPFTWVAAVIFAILTFPLGLFIPVYFYVKASQNEPPDQTPLEVWTVILAGIFGIAAVEIGGRNGAKWLWAIFGVIILLFFLLLLSL